MAESPDLAALDAALAPKSQAFVPTPKQLAYLAAACEAIADGTTLSGRALAKSADVSLQAVSEWKHKPGFCDWLADHVEREAGSRAEWALLRGRWFQRALNGDDEAGKLLIQAKAQGQAMAGSAAAAGGTTLIFNLPRPASELSGKTVIRGLLEVEPS